MATKLHIRENQTGFASLSIAFVVILIMALLSVAFVQLSRREQESALTNQLASQAFFSAESGINDVITDIKDKKITPAVAGDGTKCLNASTAGLDATARVLKNKVNDKTDATYTCALVNMTPKEIIKNDLAPNASWATSFTATDIKDVVLSWKSVKGNKSVPSSGAALVPQGARPDYPAVLEVKITPIPDAGITRDNLINQTYTFYAYPSSATPVDAYYSSSVYNQGIIVPAKCTNGICKVSITNLNSASSDTFAVRVTNYYDASNVSFGSARNLLNQSVNFTDSQAVVDVTGRAKDTFKRMQVRVPLSNVPTSASNYAIEAQNICKRQQTRPGVTEYVDLDGSVISAATGNACNGSN